MAQDPKTPRKPDTSDEDMPPAGPHADPDLTDSSKTPGTGVLPDADEAATESPTG
ncbi:hypothetical protein [Rhodoplanes roseus]|uniref:hypothetical protein n=1 Tax=Rhodoplanes roseus TaxID=29409 RepID=UPI0014743D57|nr:hypothetical protein [Rhodoplanes roseus]